MPPILHPTLMLQSVTSRSDLAPHSLQDGSSQQPYLDCEASGALQKYTAGGTLAMLPRNAERAGCTFGWTVRPHCSQPAFPMMAMMLLMMMVLTLGDCGLGDTGGCGCWDLRSGGDGCGGCSGCRYGGVFFLL